MTGNTPAQNATQISSCNWTNGVGAITGAILFALLLNINGTFNNYVATAGQTINVKSDYGAKGDTLSYGDGTVTGSTLTAAADTTNGGLTITFASPSTNAALWDVSCHAMAQQVQ